MFFYKFNKHNGKYYVYDMDTHDIFAPMFDEELHEAEASKTTENTETTETVKTAKTEEDNICRFCKTEFPTRVKMLYHLGYHGFKVKTPKNHIKYEENPELGPEGIGLKKPNKKKRPSKAAIDRLEEELRLIDIKKTWNNY